MPGGSDPTVGIHNLAYPICYMRAYINKSSKSMRIWNALSAKCPRVIPCSKSTNKAPRARRCRPRGWRPGSKRSRG